MMRGFAMPISSRGMLGTYVSRSWPIVSYLGSVDKAQLSTACLQTLALSFVQPPGCGLYFFKLLGGQKHMSQDSDLHGSIDKAVVFLIMAKRILAVWPIDNDVADDDSVAVSTTSQLVSAALDQLVPLLSALSSTDNADGPNG